MNLTLLYNIYYNLLKHFHYVILMLLSVFNNSQLRVIVLGTLSCVDMDTLSHVRVSQYSHLSNGGDTKF